MENQPSARDVVLACIGALNREDFQRAREYVSEDLAFVGVLGSRDGAEAYFRDMERMRIQYAVRKVFADVQDVCLFYDLTLSGRNIFGSAWYHVEEGKIRSLRVVFDPRPILASKPNP